MDLRKENVEVGTRAGRILLRIVERCQDQNQWHWEGKGLPLGYHPQRWCWMAAPVEKWCYWTPDGSRDCEQWKVVDLKGSLETTPESLALLWSPRVFNHLHLFLRLELTVRFIKSHFLDLSLLALNLQISDSGDHKVSHRNKMGEVEGTQKRWDKS